MSLICCGFLVSAATPCTNTAVNLVLISLDGETIPACATHSAEAPYGSKVIG